MSYHLDRRTRIDDDVRTIRPAEFFETMFPLLAAKHGALVAEGMNALGARPLSLIVDAEPWTIAVAGASIQVTSGLASSSVRMPLSAAQFSDLVQNLVSLNGLMTQRQLRCDPGDLLQVSIWDALVLTLLEGWPASTHALAFNDRQGNPLDLDQAFAPDADPADIAHFVREAGYVRLKGWLNPQDIAAISAEMDQARPGYVEGDGRSWWATMADGARACVRLQDFVDHSPATAKLMTSDVWERMIFALEGSDKLARKPVEGRIIEALFKPVGVLAGPSDLSFHRDCHLGRHAYACARMTVGVAITPADETNGMLRVVAGSHRIAMPVEVAKTRPFLPVVALPTQPGDLTVHLSCTLHEATAPISAERRVLYTEIPQRQPDDRLIDTSVAHVREQINELLSNDSGRL